MIDSEFLLLGDAVWLDFVNSARGRDPSPPDLLPDIAAFGRWARLLRLDPGRTGTRSAWCTASGRT